MTVLFWALAVIIVFAIALAAQMRMMISMVLRRALAAKFGGGPNDVGYRAAILSLGRDGQKRFSEDIKAISGGGVDIIYDGVGGNYAEPAVRAMNWEGRFLVIGFPAGIPKLPLNLTLLKSCDVRGVFWGAAVARDPKAHQQNVKELFELYKAGKIRPHVSNTYPLEKAADAIRELQDRKAQGKVVVTM